MLRIGPISLPTPAVQAALAGFSDAPMRMLARRFGAPYAVSEALLDKAIVESVSANKHRVVELADDDHPVGGQLLGSDPDMLADAAGRLVSEGYDAVDINFGCPVRKVMGKCRGGFLLGEPDAALAIVRRVRDAVPAAVPVTLKMRRGLDDDPAAAERFFTILDGARDAGIAAVTVHGRTVEQLYKGPSRWEFLAAVKRHVGPDFPIIGSGDLFTAADAVAMMARTGVDGVSLARGSIGNPWIFAEFAALAAGRPPLPGPSLAEQADVIAEHYRLAAAVHGEVKAEMVLRKFVIRYVERHPDPAGAKAALMAAKTADQRAEVFARWYR